MTDWRTEELV